MTGVVVTTAAIRCAKLQIITNNKHPVFFTGRMPFLAPNQQCQIMWTAPVKNLHSQLLNFYYHSTWHLGQNPDAVSRPNHHPPKRKIIDPSRIQNCSFMFAYLTLSAATAH